ncbi:Uma2 family endonuclease [Streptomyces sp. NPDC049906]|uniref:Uma2 family endonuclease n=1 Tax=Streptomyces sp. NPDC049906 TaxID=3155656 RepID=UPI003425F996
MCIPHTSHPFADGPAQECFEALARRAHRNDETLRLEFIDGRIVEKPMADGVHGRIVQWLTERCLDHHPHGWLHSDQGVRLTTCPQGNARPDGLLAPTDTFVGQGEWASADGVLMVVEVTSADPKTTDRDRVEKPRAYAETGIPVYLLIDRGTHEVKVHSLPDGVRYESVLTVPFGKTVPLPDPVGFDLDTGPLTGWVG